jgi:hypothetical protein
LNPGVLHNLDAGVGTAGSTAGSFTTETLKRRDHVEVSSEALPDTEMAQRNNSFDELEEESAEDSVDTDNCPVCGSAAKGYYSDRLGSYEFCKDCGWSDDEDSQDEDRADVSSRGRRAQNFE